MEHEIRLPETGFSVTEGTVVEWHKKVGESVTKDETIVSVETDKVVIEIPAQCRGILIEIRHEAGETVPIRSVLGIIRAEGEEKASSVGTFEKKRETPEVFLQNEHKEAMTLQAGNISVPGNKRKISPLARTIAEREGIDLSKISMGSGPEGRITKEDVLSLVKKKGAAEPETKTPPTTPEGQEKVKFTGWRKVIADRMLWSVRNVPQAGMFVEIDVTQVAELIASTRADANQVKLTYLPLLMKAIQVSLHVAPGVNAYCYEDGFVLQKDLHIGVAVDLGEKLIVPVVKAIREKSIPELAEEIRKLVEKARNEKLDPKDVEGGTMTVTNLGPYGIYGAMPIILPPQTTIIGVGEVRDVPSVVNGSMALRKKMMISGVFDHRVVNGGPGARFLREVKTHLEDPRALILRMR